MNKTYLVLVASLAAAPACGATIEEAKPNPAPQHSIRDHLKEPAVLKTIQAILGTTCAVAYVKLASLLASNSFRKAIIVLDKTEVKNALGITVHAATLCALGALALGLFSYTEEKLG